ncbi:MAG: hypothetical protein ACYCVV_19795 [Acidimicrobiales bacterium]
MKASKIDNPHCSEASLLEAAGSAGRPVVGLARLLPGAPNRPVLRADLRRRLGGAVATIVEGDCDIDGALGRLVDGVEL